MKYLYSCILWTRISSGICIVSPFSDIVVSDSESVNPFLMCSEFLSLGTTLVSTTMIGYRLYLSADCKLSHPVGCFAHIPRILLESAAAYSVMLLIYGINITTGKHSGYYSPWDKFTGYLEVLIMFVTVCDAHSLKIGYTSADI